jgi:hypothetical protein
MPGTAVGMGRVYASGDDMPVQPDFIDGLELDIGDHAP